MGLFVVFEGIEGSGKSTQSRALTRRLTGAGCQVKLIHEPGGTPTGERVRRWVKRGDDITHLAELFLFSAARASLVESVIRPALKRGQLVVCDRYIYSTVAYQGYGRGLEKRTILQQNEVATGGLLPELVVLLDLPADLVSVRKAGSRLDRFEREGDDFHQRVREGFLDLARQDPSRWLVMDSRRSRASLSEAVWTRVSQSIGHMLGS